MNQNTKSKLEFSIWDIMVLTSIVAIAFALPQSIVHKLIAVSLYAFFVFALLCPTALFDRREPKKGQPSGKVFFRKLLMRGIFYSLVTLALGLAVVGLNYLGS